MNSWRLLINEPLSGPMNMAIDEAILKGVSSQIVPPTIRIYQWLKPTITLGFFQSLVKEIDMEACKEKNIDVVRRLTGGRAVLHHKELTYSLTAPENHPKVKGSVLESYLAISKGLLRALEVLGVQAQLAEGKKADQKHHSSACFDAPSWYELVVAGKKLVGSAQCRKYGCILQHGSVPRQLEVDLLFSGLVFANEELRVRAKSYLVKKATCLEEQLSPYPSFKELCDSFKIGFEQGLGINLTVQPLSEEERDWVKELYETKYNNKEWNAKK